MKERFPPRTASRSPQHLPSVHEATTSTEPSADDRAPSAAPPAAGPPAAALSTVLRIRRRDGAADRGWVLAVLPAFPLFLLILRVWFLSGQDPRTMVLLLQHTSSLGLMSSLIITDLWTFPAVCLLLRCLGLLLQVSAVQVGRRNPVRLMRWVPGWLALPSVVLASLTWQLRFLPTLVMLMAVMAVLTVRLSSWGDGRLGRVARVTVPFLTGLAVLGWTVPGAVNALRAGEHTTFLLLTVPPVAGCTLTGPLPWPVARRLLPAVALLLGLVFPSLAGTQYLNTPVLPRVALTTEHSLSDYLDAGIQTQASLRAGGVHPTSRVLVGDLVAVDDHSFVLLTLGGRVVFVPVSQVRKEVLCTTAPAPPFGSVSVHGWHTEMSLLSWAGPQPATVATDPSCRV